MLRCRSSQVPNVRVSSNLIIRRFPQILCRNFAYKPSIIPKAIFISYSNEKKIEIKKEFKRSFSTLTRKPNIKSNFSLHKIPKRNTASDALIAGGLVIDGLFLFTAVIGADGAPGLLVAWLLIHFCVLIIYLWNQPEKKEQN
jgi:hypothetical protein